ncbi:acyltransferase ChoActase/COT/CPT [Crucibulum laeve]|uniref:Acyltransferase ChoActase/COT/CPT n=1 Tax=Crucibulum laeve TaxID=68775 RepID=A0A5C3LKF6_9AGAR|nr:acyltransferase ChoActase/COT/CPT [Crucibulum laeve]
MIRTRLQSIRPPPMSSRSSSSSHASGPSTRTPVLPRLPVPDLHKTLSKYLTSLEPFFLEDELRGGMSYASAHALRTKWADEFASGIGHVLQDRLLALDKASPNNWLDDNFWINKAYLEWRAPLLINSNWWLAFFEDDLIPKSAISGETSDSRAGTTFWQIRRAAWLVHRVLDFKEKLDTQELHPETTRTGIWLRDSTSKMFNIARIPKEYCDVLSTPSASSPYSHCVLVMVHNWCYAVPVYHSLPTPQEAPTPASATSDEDPECPTHSLNLGELMSPPEIEKRLRAVVLDVEARLANGEKAVPVGLLSADDRDRWAENLNHLLALSPTNFNSHQAILHSVIGLSLEHTTHTLRRSQYPDTSPTQLNRDSHLHCIRSTPYNVANRIFDKPLTLVVDPSTRAGATGEHSPCDALVPSIVAEYGIVQGVEVEEFGEDDGSKSVALSGAEKAFERLDFVMDDKLSKECSAAEERAHKIIADSDDSVLWFDAYGTEWIKNSAKLSPDAYIQMALQLAWYKTRESFTATYETVLTRMFKRGRTETVRTFTRDSREWVLSMVDSRASPQIRRRLLQRAIQTHSRLTREAATGRGIDRHLLGLRLLLRPLNGESAALFEDELFELSSQWKLSTSGLSAGHLFKGTGFGAMYDDGYGINYLAAPHMIKFGIESKYSNSLTSTDTFKKVVIESLHEMQAICSTSEVVDAPAIHSHL